MLFYAYHPVTKEFLGSATARESPKESGVFLVPANATIVAAGVAPSGSVRVFDPQTELWSSVEDHRGETVYRKSDASKIIVDWLGEIGEDYTRKSPATLDDEWNGTAWITPPPKKEHIKFEANKRISDVMPTWMVERHITSDTKIPQSILDHAEAVRQASDTLEQTLPTDYTDDKHWPTKPE